MEDVQFDIILQDKEIEQVHEVKLLRVTVDEQLSSNVTLFYIILF